MSTTEHFYQTHGTLDIQNAQFMIPRALTQIVQEGIEPYLIGKNLLQRVPYKQGMMTVFPAIEPLRAEGAATVWICRSGTLTSPAGRASPATRPVTGRTRSLRPW